VQISLFCRTEIVTVFRGTPQELRYEIRVQGRERTIVGMRELPSPGNRTGASPVAEA